MTFNDPNLNRVVRTPCGEDVHLAGLSELLKGIWGISSIGHSHQLGTPETEAEIQPIGPQALETMIVNGLGGVPAHPPIQPGSNVVSIFRNQ